MSGPLPAAMVPLAVPVSWVYGRVIARRNLRYDRDRGIARVDAPVISVGNITAGGAGKSPLVLWLAERLLERGRHPVIAMRGYAAERGAASDEQEEYLDRLAGVDVLADPDRATALRRYLPRHPEVDCVLLDDAFQHRRLHRDLDLVVVDASRRTLDDHLLPRGFLREPPAGLRRADAVVVTRAEAEDPALAAAIARVHGRAPVAWSRHVWSALHVFRPGSEPERVACTWLAGRRAVAVFGVAHPRSIHAQLIGAGATVVAEVPARDHARYTARTLARLRRRILDAGADVLVTTWKDWTKMRRVMDLPAWPAPVVVPELTLQVFRGRTELEARVAEAATRDSSEGGTRGQRDKGAKGRT